MKTIKPKRCKQCGKDFIPMRSTAICCNYQCAKDYVDSRKAKLSEQKAKLEAKIDRQITKERKEKLKSLRDWKKDVQAWCNKYIRLRDANEPCISCGRHHQGQYHAGHYLSVGSHPELRWDERNIYKQCAPCNNHLSGNLIEYRKRLIKIKGQKLVDWLEGPHEPLKPTIDDCKELITMFKRKIKEL